MKYLKIIIIVLLPIAFIGGSWITHVEPVEIVSTDSVPEVNEIELLISYLEENGDFINIPDLERATSVTAQEVQNNIGNKKFHIIDIRGGDDYYPAHIPGAAHVEATELYEYMKSIPINYIDKIVLVCYAGQRASYNTGLLRMLGYNKVYFMKYGMSAWTNSVAQANWTKNVSNSYSGKLSEVSTKLPDHTDLPTIYTLKTTGRSILEARIIDLIQEDYSVVKIKADELMANPTNYFIVQFDQNLGEKELKGIEGSYSFKPGSSLKLSADLKALPTYDPIVVTSVNGQTSGMVAAYLRTLGYDARFLTYGLSALAFNSLKESGLEVFTSKEIMGYKTASKKAPVVVNKPKKAAGGC